MKKKNNWEKKEEKLFQEFLKGAIRNRSKEIKKHPNSAIAYFERGLFYGEKGDDKKAITDFSKAIKINPNYAEAFNHRAISYFYIKEHEKAWKDVHKAETLGCDTKFVRSLLRKTR